MNSVLTSCPSPERGGELAAPPLRVQAGDEQACGDGALLERSGDPEHLVPTARAIRLVGVNAVADQPAGWGVVAVAGVPEAGVGESGEPGREL